MLLLLLSSWQNYFVLYTPCAIVNKNIIRANEDSMEIVQYLKDVSKINVYCDGKKYVYRAEDMVFRLIINEMEYILSDAHDNPAFGVSLHEETIQAMRQGKWIELCFDREMIYNEMNFESWLIQIESQGMGFNIIRKYQGKYEGRCYYERLVGGKTLGGIDTIIEDEIKK